MHHSVVSADHLSWDKQPGNDVKRENIKYKHKYNYILIILIIILFQYFRPQGEKTLIQYADNANLLQFL